MTNKLRLSSLPSVLLLASLAVAQDPVNPALRPPQGAQVAIVAFEDLECPDCRRAMPVVEGAARAHNVPLIRHDFPLPSHQWSFAAAVTARYFDAQSKDAANSKDKDLGNHYRDYIFTHQPEITADTLRSFSEKFAADHKVDLPAVVDPDGKFAALVTADRDLGKDLHLHATPTIYVVSNRTQGKAFVELVDRTQLDQLIDAMKAAP